MGRQQRAVIALRTRSTNDRILLGESIVQALTEHSKIFVNPSPSIQAIADATKELRDANDEAITGSLAGKQRVKKASLLFSDLLAQFQTYVNLTANGDGETIEKSGLQVSRDAQRTGPLAAPQSLRLSGNNVGQLQVNVERVLGGKTYVWMVCQSATSPSTHDEWRFLTATTISRVVLNDLPSGARMWVRCAAVGPKGLGPWSEPVSRIVL
jgi:hypothetical protein